MITKDNPKYEKAVVLYNDRHYEIKPYEVDDEVQCPLDTSMTVTPIGDGDVIISKRSVFSPFKKSDTHK